MLRSSAAQLRKLSFIKQNKVVNNFLKTISLKLSKILYGDKKLVAIAGKYKFYLDSDFAFANYESWGEKHNGGFEKLIEVSKDKKVIFDIGGHIGLCALPMSTNISQESVIYSFEPSNRNRYYLQKHIELNDISNIYVIDSLLGDTNKENVEFFELNDVSGTPSIVNIKEGFQKVLKKQVTLDSFCEDNRLIPDLLKIDVEGAEFFVLNGGTKIIKMYKPDIVLSLHPKHLNKLGLDMNYLFEFCDKYKYEIFNCSDMKRVIKGNDLLFDEYYLKAN